MDSPNLFLQPHSRDENPNVTESESPGAFGSKYQWGMEEQGVNREVNGIGVDWEDDLGFIVEHYAPGHFPLGKREKGKKRISECNLMQ